MEKRKNTLWIGIISFFSFFAMEIVTNIWFGSKYPGYNWKTQSLSYLGQSGSPLEKWVLLWGVFPKIKNPKLHVYLWTVVGIGLVMVSFFLVAKYFRPDNFIVSYKGVWQRVYLFNYYIMLLVVNWKMTHQIKLE